MNSLFKVILMALGASIITACTNSLPSCSSKEAKNTVQKIINNIDKKTNRIGKFVELKDIQENAYNEKDGIRTCSAELNTTKTVEDINYSISWINKKKGEFYVEIHE